MPEGTRRIMRKFSIFEISAVDRPAQKDARMTIMKRDFSSEERQRLADEGKAMSDGSYPIVTVGDLTNAIQSFGRAANKGGVKAHIIKRARALGATDKLPADWNVGKKSEVAEEVAKYWIDPANGAVPFSVALSNCMTADNYQEVMREVGSECSALDTSVRSILADPNMDSVTKQTALRQTVEDFMSSVRNEWPAVEATVSQIYAPESADTMKQGDGSMTAKTVEQLTQELADINKRLETSAAALTAAQGDITKLTTASEASKVALGKLESENKELTIKAGMSDAEKEYMSRLAEGDRQKFRDMAPDERAAAMKKRDDADEILTVEGQQIRKSVVGAAQFAMFKAQQKRLEDMEKRANTEQEGRENAEYTKQAEETLGHLPGTVLAKVKALVFINKITDIVKFKDDKGVEKEESVKDTVLKMLEAGDKAISAAYDRVGTRPLRKVVGAAGDPAAFDKRVDEIKTANKGISHQEATRKAREQYPDDFKAYQEAGAVDAPTGH